MTAPPVEPNVDDRIAAALRAVIRAEVPELTYGALWEYAVTSVNDDGTINGRATAPIPLPDLNRVPLGALALGGSSTPAIGSSFLVEFVNQSGALGAVFSCAPKVDVSNVDATQTVNVGASADVVNLGPSPEKDTARVGDSVTCFFPLGVLTGTLGGMPFTGPLQITTPASGVVTSGRLEVQL
jgi:hypothetical protein